jgi:hypothetical protein
MTILVMIKPFPLLAIGGWKASLDANGCLFCLGRGGDLAVLGYLRSYGRLTLRLRRCVANGLATGVRGRQIKVKRGDGVGVLSGGGNGVLF